MKFTFHHAFTFSKKHVLQGPIHYGDLAFLVQSLRLYTLYREIIKFFKTQLSALSQQAPDYWIVQAGGSSVHNAFGMLVLIAGASFCIHGNYHIT